MDRISAVFPLAGGSMLFGLLFAGYGFIPIAWMPAAMVASGVFSAMMLAPTLSMCAELSPLNQRGAAYAGFNAAGSLSFICGPLVGGLLGALLSGSLGITGAHRVAFVVGGVAEFTCAPATLPLLLRLQRAGLLRSRSKTESDADRRPAAATGGDPMPV